MPTVAISVDCEAANVGKCYTRELVRIAEEYTAPLTWLIYVSEKDPTSNVDLYHAEYLHRIPAWHEIGLLLGFENSKGPISDPKERGDAIRIGKDTVKSRHIKPTSFRAHRADLMPSDLPHLDDVGILVEASACPGSRNKDSISGTPGPTQPYHPSKDHLSEEGDSKIWIVPLATGGGICAYLDFGWDKVKKVVSDSLDRDRVTHIAVSDYVDSIDTLRKTLALCREKGARIVTLTQLASEL